MNKLVVVINGKGGAGKDTLCRFVSNHYKVLNVSSIDPIKELARFIGWDGTKDNSARKLLSDLKKIATDYNDFPTRYLLEKYEQFLSNDDEIMFVHIREKEQIAHFVASVNQQAVTLLIRRSDLGGVYGNVSDDNVEDYAYDYIYQNDLPLAQAEDDFMRFFDTIYQKDAVAKK